MLRELFKKLFGSAPKPDVRAELIIPPKTASPDFRSDSESQEKAAHTVQRGGTVPSQNGAESSIKWSRPTRLPIDLDIGFDLGTSCTKVVIGDREANRHTAVPINGGRGLAGYLLPSRVYLCGGVYSLDPTPGCVTRRDLKMQIMQSAHRGQAVSPDALCDLAAFAALVIRRVLVWYALELAASYPGREPVWHLNVGLPSRGGANDRFAETYRRLMRIAAWLIPGDTAITRERAESFVNRAERTWLPDDRMNMFPESGAQLASLILSPHRPTGCLLVVDVGAGTMDISALRIGGDATAARCVIHCCEVAPLGVQYLCLARKGLWSPHGITPNALAELPDDDGMRGLQIRDGSVPAAFVERCKQSVLPVVAAYRGKLKRAHHSPSFRPWSEGLPFVLSGGGHRDAFYQNLLQRNLETWLTTVVSEWDSPGRKHGGLKLQKFPTPRSFSPNKLLPDFDRFSVAHGLSLGVDGLMEMRDVSGVQAAESTGMRSQEVGTN